MGEAEKIQTIKAGSRFRMVKTGCLRRVLILCFLIPSIKATAPVFSTAYILVTEPINIYERLIRAIVMVESLGDTLAVNLPEEAYGAFQIRPIRLMDYYQRTGKNYKTEDCFNFEISKEIFLYYAENMGYNDYQSIARNWNGSGKMTIDYWEKIKKYLYKN
jgi:hypothetical protein